MHHDTAEMTESDAKMATDPVCGMKVDRSKAVTKEFDDETFYFCTEHCLHAFEAQSGRYIGDQGGEVSTPTHTH